MWEKSFRPPSIWPVALKPRYTAESPGSFKSTQMPKPIFLRSRCDLSQRPSMRLVHRSSVTPRAPGPGLAQRSPVLLCLVFKAPCGLTPLVLLASSPQINSCPGALCLFAHSFRHSSNKHLLSTSWVPGTTPGQGFSGKQVRPDTSFQSDSHTNPRGYKRGKQLA